MIDRQDSVSTALTQLSDLSCSQDLARGHAAGPSSLHTARWPARKVWKLREGQHPCLVRQRPRDSWSEALSLHRRPPPQGVTHRAQRKRMGCEMRGGKVGSPGGGSQRLGGNDGRRGVCHLLPTTHTNTHNLVSVELSSFYYLCRINMEF